MEEEVRTVRDAYEAWNAMGPHGLQPWITDDLELRDPPQMPDARAWCGREEVLARLEEVAESIGGRWAELREVREAGNEVFVSMTWQVDSSRDSAVLGDVFHLVALAGGRISRIRVFLTEEDARAATGG